MWSNNNYSTSRLLGGFHAIIMRRNKEIVDSGLRPQCEIAPLTTYFLNLSPVNVKNHAK